MAAPRHLTLSIGVDPAQTRVTLEVRDTGLGMAPEVQARIFEPFFTTKPWGRHGAGPALRGFLRTMVHPGVYESGGAGNDVPGGAAGRGPSRRRLRCPGRGG